MRWTWKQRGVLAVIAAALASAAGVGPAAAERVTFPLVHVRQIASDAGVSRVLLDPGDISALNGELVTSAFLRLPLPGHAPVEDLDIVVHALRTGWDGQGVGWRTPWVRPGGDLDSRYSHTVRLGKGREAAAFALDVTLMLQEMADGVAGKNGFLLTIPAGRGDGFAAADRVVLGSLAQGELEVTFRRISELGFTNGSRSGRGN